MLTESVVNLGSHLVAEQKLSSALARFGGELNPWDWVLVGGQMVALHGYIAGIIPPRTSEDIDVVANVLVRQSSLEACASAAKHINLQPKRPCTAAALTLRVRWPRWTCHDGSLLPRSVPATE